MRVITTTYTLDPNGEEWNFDGVISQSEQEALEAYQLMQSDPNVKLYFETSDQDRTLTPVLNHATNTYYFI